MALLTTHQRHPVQKERQAQGQDAYWVTFWDDEDLFYGHVLGFKGLERPAVVLAVNGIRDEARAREMLYVDLSRARDCSSSAATWTSSAASAGRVLLSD